MATEIVKREIVQLVGAILAFAPQALVIKDIFGTAIPKEVVPMGYLLLVIGFGWEAFELITNK